MADRRGISGRALGRLGNSLGAPPFILSYNSSVATGTSTTEVIIADAQYAFRVINAWFVSTEAAGADDTAKLTDGTSDITDAPNFSGNGDTDITNWGEIDDDYHEISKGGTIKLVKTETTAVSMIQVYILCVRI